jgi:hypothetical protein
MAPRPHRLPNRVSAPAAERARGAIIGTVAGIVAEHTGQDPAAALSMPDVDELVAVGGSLRRCGVVDPEDLAAALRGVHPEARQSRPRGLLRSAHLAAPIAVRFAEDTVVLDRQARLGADALEDSGIAAEAFLCQTAAIAAAIREEDVIAVVLLATKHHAIRDALRAVGDPPAAPAEGSSGALARALWVAITAASLEEAVQARPCPSSGPLLGSVAGARFGGQAAMEYLLLGAGERPPQARLLALQRLADELAADADRPVTMATTLATRRQSA